METIIKAKKTLFNAGKCFTEGQTYTVTGNIKTAPGLMDCMTINDLKEPHLIGSWWRNFKIISNNLKLKITP